MTFSVKTLVVSLVLGASTILAQDSTTTDFFTIQTSLPGQSNSGSSTASPASVSGSGSGSNSASGSSSTASAPASTSSSSAGPALFPQQCTGQCTPIASALASCGAGDTLNTTCLCTPTIEGQYQTCLQCALDADPTDAERTDYQATMDAFIDQCANAPLNPVTLPNATITLASNSQSGSSSASGSSLASNSASITSSSASRSSTSGMVLPSSAVSHPPLSTSSAAPATSSAAASGSGGSNAAPRRTGSNNALMSVGFAGVVGAVIVAAAI